MTEFEKEEKLFKEPIDGVLYAAACGIKNKGQIEKLEKPSEELEEEIERYLSTEWKLDEDLNKDEPIYIYDCTWEDLKIFARHFAEWQKMKDYDRYAHVSLKDIHDAWHKLKETNPDIEKHPAVCFARGADWQKEQMLKESVEARVFNVIPSRSVVMYDAYYPNGVPHNDKGVIGKLIFVKE